MSRPKRAAGAILPQLGDATSQDRSPLHRQLYRRIRGAILAGALPPGSRLPSGRTLADDLGVSRNTVEAALMQLQAEGFLERRVGSGSYVAAALPGTPPRQRARGGVAEPPVAAGVERLSRRGRLAVAGGSLADPTAARAFAPCTPSLDDFPMARWNRLLARRARTHGHALLGPGDPAGYRPLREAVAAYLGAARGVRCEWRQVLIVTSTQQAIDLVARMVLDPGDAVWIEDPGYLGARAALAHAGGRLVPVPVDPDGLAFESAAAKAPAARLAYVTPSHQYPLGVTLSLARRLRLLEWSARSGAWILEDDYDSEFRYEGRPLAALQGLDGAGRVLYAGTFNKVLFPSLRLAYLVVPEGLMDAFAAARTLSDPYPPALAQAVLADFVADGHFAAHLRHLRAVYRERRDVFVAAIEATLRGRLRLGPVDTGMHATGWLPDGEDDRAVSRRAADAGLDVPPLSRYFLGTPSGAGLVLQYAAMGAEDIRSGVQGLAKVLGR